MGKSKSINFKAVSFQRGKRKTVQKEQGHARRIRIHLKAKDTGTGRRKQPSLKKIIKEAADSVESPVCIK